MAVTTIKLGLYWPRRITLKTKKKKSLTAQNCLTSPAAGRALLGTKLKLHLDQCSMPFPAHCPHTALPQPHLCSAFTAASAGCLRGMLLPSEIGFLPPCPAGDGLDDSSGAIGDQDLSGHRMLYPSDHLLHVCNKSTSSSTKQKYRTVRL